MKYRANDIWILQCLIKYCGTRDSAVGIVIGYGLDDSDRSSIQEFLFLYVVQTGSGAHPASYPMGTGAVSPGVKRPGREADHSPLISAEVKEIWIYTSIPPYAFMA
jgi:hypothetical protein